MEAGRSASPYIGSDLGALSDDGRPSKAKGKSKGKKEETSSSEDSSDSESEDEKPKAKANGTVCLLNVRYGVR